MKVFRRPPGSIVLVAVLSSFPAWFLARGGCRGSGSACFLIGVGVTALLAWGLGAFLLARFPDRLLEGGKESADSQEKIPQSGATPETREAGICSTKKAQAVAGTTDKPFEDEKVPGATVESGDPTGKFERGTSPDELERAVRERTRALAEVNNQLDAFNYSISHDLRAPLRAIDGFSQILLNEHARGLTPEGRRLLGIVVKNTKQMARLIDDLLAFSRLGRQEPTLEEVDMAALARDTFDDLVAGEPPREIEFNLGPLPMARGDPSMLRQVWANLLSNAVKFTGRTARAVITVSGKYGLDGSTYLVKDNGAGFDPKFAERLFQVFQRLHSSGEFSGTGVGLAIVKRVIQKHGGRVWAEGTPQEGAVFYFTLPNRANPG